MDCDVVGMVLRRLWLEDDYQLQGPVLHKPQAGGHHDTSVGDAFGSATWVLETLRVRRCNASFLCGPEATHHRIGGKALVSFEGKPSIDIKIYIHPRKTSDHPLPASAEPSTACKKLLPEPSTASSEHAKTDSSELPASSEPSTASGQLKCCLCDEGRVLFSPAGECKECRHGDFKERVDFPSALDCKNNPDQCRAECVKLVSKCCFCKDNKVLFSPFGKCEECGKDGAKGDLDCEACGHLTCRTGYNTHCNEACEKLLPRPG